MKINKKLVEKYKKPCMDLILNTIAYAMPVLTAQVIVLPLISKQTNSDTYGYIVTINSLMSLIPHTIGNTLNNVRLVRSKEYDENNIKGDYNILVLISEMLSVIAFAIGWLYYTEEKSFSHFSLLIVLCALWMCREYIIVAFRMKINYKKICINNALFSLGYIVGIVLFLAGAFGEFWEFIYIVAQLFSIVYVICNSDLIREPFVRTCNFIGTVKSYTKLLVSNIISSVGDNLDKLLIYSLLGGTSVSIFYAASIYTKVISLAVTPISGVLLSYLAKKRSISKSSLAIISFASICMAIIGYVLCLIIAKPVISILYNEYLNEALKYVKLTAAYAMLRLMYALLRPFMMNFKDLNWQIAINAVAVVVFIGLGLVLVPKYSITGMCISYIIGGIVRIVLIFVAFFGNTNVLHKTRRNYEQR